MHAFCDFQERRRFCFWPIISFLPSFLPFLLVMHAFCELQERRRFCFWRAGPTCARSHWTRPTTRTWCCLSRTSSMPSPSTTTPSTTRSTGRTTRSGPYREPTWTGQVGREGEGVCERFVNQHCAYCQIVVQFKKILHKVPILLDNFITDFLCLFIVFLLLFE